MMEFAAQLSRNSKPVAKIKNNLNYALGYYAFLFIKNMGTLSLPYSMYYILEAKFIGYVIIAVQIKGLKA